jgi:hypothetical protein
MNFNFVRKYNKFQKFEANGFSCENFNIHIKPIEGGSYGNIHLLTTNNYTINGKTFGEQKDFALKIINIGDINSSITESTAKNLSDLN